MGGRGYRKGWEGGRVGRKEGINHSYVSLYTHTHNRPWHEGITLSFDLHDEQDGIRLFSSTGPIRFTGTTIPGMYVLGGREGREGGREGGREVEREESQDLLTTIYSEMLYYLIHSPFHPSLPPFLPSTPTAPP